MPTGLSDWLFELPSRPLTGKSELASPSYFRGEIEFKKFESSKWEPVTKEGGCGELKNLYFYTEIFFTSRRGVYNFT